VTAGKAKSDFLRKNDLEYEYYKNIRCRRASMYDLLSPMPNEDTIDLTTSQISKMSHAIGEDFLASEPYRNYYQVNDDAEWNDLIIKGLAEKGNNHRLNYYYLNERGLTAIKSLKPLSRHSLSNPVH